MIYAVVSMTALCGIVSLAVDYARVQLTKTELQRVADSCARTAALSMSSGQTDANTKFFTQYLAGLHTADGSAVTLAAADVEFGYWDGAAKTFTVKPSSFSANALRITVARTTSRGNAIPLMWARALGKSSCDVTTQAIAYFAPTKVQTFTIDPTKGDLWLAGMPAGSAASYDDTSANGPPSLGLPLEPGSYISFSGASGTVTNSPTGTMVSADGNVGNILTHGADSPGGPTPAAENGVADIVSPINALLGVFLDENAPNTTSAPSRRDYTTAASRDETSYDDIELKQPFFVGDGRTSGGTTQQFQVPLGATRLFLGTMDGYQWHNNLGSFTITVTVPSRISLVK